MNPVRSHSKPVVTGNGVNQFLKAASPVTLDYNDAFTFKFWIKPETPTATVFIWSNEAASTAKGIRIQLDTSRLLSILLVNDFSTARVQVTSDVALTASEWQYVEIIYTGSGNAAGISFKIDNVTVADTDNVDQTISAGITSTELPRIFTRPAEDSGFFEGEIADFEIEKNSVDHNHLELYEGNETIALDSEKNNNHTLEGAEWLLAQSGCNDTLASNPTEAGVPQLIDKELNNYDFFNGINKVLLPNTPFTDITGDKPFVIEFLYYNTGAEQLIMHWGAGNIGSSDNGMAFGITSSGVIVLRVDNDTTDTIKRWPAQTNGSYFKLTATINHTNATITSYSLVDIDGSTVTEGGTGTISIFKFSSTLVFGRRGNNARYYFGILISLALTSEWKVSNFKKWVDEIGSNDATFYDYTVSSGDVPDSNPINIIENPNDIGNDLLLQSIQDSIKIGGVKKKWNIYQNTYFETTDTLSVDEFVCFFILDGNALSSLTNAILLDARDADNDGILLHINSSGYPEIQFNTQDVAGSSVLSDARQIITFWATDTDLKIRIDGTEVATATKTGGSISTTNFITLFAEAFGTKANYFTGQCLEVLYIPSNVALATVEDFENDFITEYLI